MDPLQGCLRGKGELKKLPKTPREILLSLATAGSNLLQEQCGFGALQETDLAQGKLSHPAFLFKCPKISWSNCTMAPFIQGARGGREDSGLVAWQYL
jgi:hypothetical protein